MDIKKEPRQKHNFDAIISLYNTVGLSEVSWLVFLSQRPRLINMKTRQTTFRIHFNRLVSTTLSRPWTKNIFILFHGGGVGRSVWMRGRQMLKFFGQDHHRHGHRHHHRSADLLRLWKFSLCFNRYSQITNHKMHIRSSLLANVIRSNWDTMTSSFAVKKLFQSIYFLWRFPHFVWLSPTIYLHSYLPTSYLPTYLHTYQGTI